MAWTQSGLFTAVLEGNLGLTAAYPNWLGTTTSGMYLTNNSDAPNYSVAAASAIYATTNEVHDSSGWPAGGVACSALAAGSTSIAPAWNVVTGPTVLQWKASNVSVASTTLASPGTFGGYFYMFGGATKYQWIGIYFGGTGYITTAGTFAITWSSGIIATIQCTAT